MTVSVRSHAGWTVRVRRPFPGRACPPTGGGRASVDLPRVPARTYPAILTRFRVAMGLGVRSPNG
jgi:hypothetical protein